jgi:hypothetical protein
VNADLNDTSVAAPFAEPSFHEQARSFVAPPPIDDGRSKRCSADGVEEPKRRTAEGHGSHRETTNREPQSHCGTTERAQNSD